MQADMAMQGQQKQVSSHARYEQTVQTLQQEHHQERSELVKRSESSINQQAAQMQQ